MCFGVKNQLCGPKNWVSTPQKCRFSLEKNLTGMFWVALWSELSIRVRQRKYRTKQVELNHLGAWIKLYTSMRVSSLLTVPRSELSTLSLPHSALRMACSNPPSCSSAAKLTTLTLASVLEQLYSVNSGDQRQGCHSCLLLLWSCFSYRGCWRGALILFLGLQDCYGFSFGRDTCALTTATPRT